MDVLQQVLDRRFPRNFLLSHDLIEGFYARAGLVTDVCSAPNSFVGLASKYLVGKEVFWHTVSWVTDR